MTTMRGNASTMVQIPEHQQLTRLQAYLLASSAWSWLRHDQSCTTSGKVSSVGKDAKSGTFGP